MMLVMSHRVWFVDQTHAQQRGISPRGLTQKVQVVAELTVSAKVAGTWYTSNQLYTTSGQNPNQR